MGNWPCSYHLFRFSASSDKVSGFFTLNKPRKNIITFDLPPIQIQVQANLSSCCEIFNWEQSFFPLLLISTCRICIAIETVSAFSPNIQNAWDFLIFPYFWEKMNRHQDFPPVGLPFLPGREKHEKEEILINSKRCRNACLKILFRKQSCWPDETALSPLPVACLW